MCLIWNYDYVSWFSERYVLVIHRITFTGQYLYGMYLLHNIYFCGKMTKFFSRNVCNPGLWDKLATNHQEN